MATRRTNSYKEDEKLSEPELVENSDSIEKVPVDRAPLNALALVAEEEKKLGTWASVTKYWVVFLWCMYISIGAAIGGYDGTVAGAVISIPTFRSDLGSFIDGQYVVSAAWQSGFNGGSSCGGLFGALATGWLGDRIGRRGSLLVASIISIAAIFLEVFCIHESQVMFFFGRSINGFGGGIFTTVASSYCAEISPLQLRGITTGAVNEWIVVGQFISSCVIKGTGEINSSWAYKIPLAIQWVFPVLILLGLPFIPESPWYFVRKEDDVKAKRSLQRLIGNTGADLDLHLAQIKETIELEERLAGQAKWIDLFKGTDLRRTWITAMVFVCQEMVGVQFVLGYSTYFFELAGFSTSNSFSLGVGTLGIAFVGNLLGIAFTNYLGRRPIFVWGMVACTIDCLMIGILSLVPGNGALWAMGVFTMLYMLVYQAGIGPLAYCIYAEISSARLRSKTVAWGVMVNQAFGLLITVINPYLINPNEANLQGKVGWIFGGFGAIFTVWSYFGIPETSGRTIDEIDILFARHVPSRKFSKYVITDADRE
ncbi:maltose permease [Calocera viscosa TUFC12733]|uniref:Maltose permease n=1 Tax=Calocera viscosa (strain TUFC12733) TaxID=1330018 RepID=A0A167M228_CALVF|nr:maltose permease [Calocera viscosa TUFC12733]